MTRRRGDFARRGVHVVDEDGSRRPISTPDLSAMRCRWCGAAGVTVTAAIEGADGLPGRLFGWCDLDHMRLSGVTMPAGDHSRDVA